MVGADVTRPSKAKVKAREPRLSATAGRVLEGALQNPAVRLSSWLYGVV